MTALFAVVFVEQWEEAQSHISALLGLISAVLCLLLFGAGHFQIPTMLVISLGLLLLRPWIEGKEKEEE